MEIVLGQKVIYKSVMKRISSYDNEARANKRYYIEMHHEPIEGVVIGIRTVHNGWSEYTGEGEGYIFSHESSIQVALVATSLYRNPEKVLLSALTPND